MSPAGKCRECGAALPADGPVGICAKCLLALGLQQAQSETIHTAADASSAPEEPPESPRKQAAGKEEPSSAFSTEKPGDHIGPYKLLEQIGKGGFGVVYLAEQHEPVKRRVALKIIKLGMDTTQVVARFEVERQALALMDHPNIAKILEAGATETGRPYFVMELVGGIKITDYCEQNNLTTRQRLDLFIQVCRAIQHAHQKGVIHRDIKPSNVLVAAQDGVPVPKVIDFGIAKATQGKLTDQTVFTAFEQFLGTPAYMSPEQAQLGSLDVDTRSDIYSLGVLLYELLTGKTPFDTKELLAAGLEAMRRTILEKEPPTPSTRLKLDPATRSGKSDIRNPTSEIDKDLDWIVMKCLEKDRGRRYDTANGLAMDLQRYANHEPVVARPPTNAYRFRKLVRRHKLAFATGAAVCASLLIGLGVSTVLYFREQQQAANAKEQEAIAQAVNDFLQQDLLQQADSWSQADAQFAPNPNLTVREALDRAASRIGDRFTNQPLQEAAVRTSIGLALMGVGEAGRATPHLQRALDLRRTKLGPDHPDTLTSMNNLARGYRAAGKLDQALPLSEETLERSKGKLGPDHPCTLDLMNSLAHTYLATGKLDQALPLLKATLNLMKTKLGPDHPNTLATMNNLASAFKAAGKLDQALPLFEETVKLKKTKLGPDHPDTLATMNNLASAYRDAGKLDQALPLYEETLKLRKARLGPDHPDTLTTMNDVALAFDDVGKRDQSVALFEETLKLTKAKLGPEHPNTLTSMANLAQTYRAAGKRDQALVLSEETLKLRKATLGPDHPDTLTSMNNLAKVYEASGKLKQALPLYEETLKLTKAKLGADHPNTMFTMHNLAGVYHGAGQFYQSLPLYEESLKLIKAKLGPDHPRTFLAINNLANAYRDTGKLDQSGALYEETLNLMKTKLGPEHPDTLGLMRNLAAVYEDAGKREQSMALFEETLKLAKTRLGPEHAETLRSMSSLGRAYLAAGKPSESEQVASECLGIYETKFPDNWRTFSTRSLLGGSLLAQKKYAEAEPLLLSGYEGMLQRESQIPGWERRQLAVALRRLVQLYEAQGRADRVGEWRLKLQAFEPAQPPPGQPGPKPATQP